MQRRDWEQRSPFTPLRPNQPSIWRARPSGAVVRCHSGDISPRSEPTKTSVTPAPCSKHQGPLPVTDDYIATPLSCVISKCDPPPHPTHAHILSNRLDIFRLIDTCKLAPGRRFGLCESEEGCRARLSWRTACTTGVTDCLCSDEVSAMVCNRNSNKFRRGFKDWMHYTGLGVIHKCLAVCVHTSTRCGDYLHIHPKQRAAG